MDQHLFLILNLSGISVFEWEQLPEQPGQFIPHDLFPFFLSLISFLMSY